MPQHQFTATDLQRAVELYQQGYGYERIASQLGFAYGTVRYNLRRAGATLRTCAEGAELACCVVPNLEPSPLRPPRRRPYHEQTPVVY